MRKLIVSGLVALAVMAGGCSNDFNPFTEDGHPANADIVVLLRDYEKSPNYGHYAHCLRLADLDNNGEINRYHSRRNHPEKETLTRCYATVPIGPAPAGR